MKYQCPDDLIAQFNENERLTLRSESSGVGAKIPPFVCAILSFCSIPRSKAEIQQQLGSQASGLVEQLIEIGLLCSKGQAIGKEMQCYVIM